MPKIKPLAVTTNLLDHNQKMSKTYVEKGIVIVGLSLHSGRVKGVNMCPTAVRLGLDCLKLCLKYAGNGRFKVVQNARYWRTVELIESPETFNAKLDADINLCQAMATKLGVGFAVRVNVLSDTPLGIAMARKYPAIQWYDYTKEKNRFRRFLRGELPKNYDLTWSVSEADNPRWLRSILHRGGRIAIVYGGEMPEDYLGFPVVDGDKHDARYLEPGGVVVALKAKGKARGEGGKGSLFVLQ